MFEFLTLAITETTVNTGKFNVIAMETKSQNIVPFGFNKEHIISETGEVFWDIGFTTIVGERPKRKYTNNDSSPFVLNGSAELNQNKISSLKSILDAKSASGLEFFENEKLKFCVLKVSKVENINCKIDNSGTVENIKHYLSFYVNGLSVDKSPISILNKDYRWKNYWNWIYANDNYEEKKKKYLKLLNRRDKNLYLILYRHTFKTGETSNWIVGMHWL